MSAQLNRWRMKFGLLPKPRVGQVWEVEYSGWNNTEKFAYFLLLRQGESHKWKGVTTERWHVYDLGRGCYYAGELRDIYSMPFEWENGTKKCPYYRLVTEAP